MIKVQNFIARILSFILNRYSLPAFEKLVYKNIARRAQQLPADEALRMLFRLDAELYSLQGKTAVAYGNGTHPKHRHLNYHDFFVQRIQSSQHVLDIGCGIGAVAFDIAQKAGAQVVGIDFSERNILQARAMYAHPSVEYRIGDALQELPGERFNVVILSNVLEHLPERGDFLRKVQQVIKPEYILIRVPLFERDWRVPLKKELEVEWRLDPTHETEYTLESFEEEISSAGLRVAHLEVRWGEIWAQVSSI
jgi:2-polyprenyl-3-methyl-5-hydroxy-6-metoxy-1,4-benzoquinol methylase